MSARIPLSTAFGVDKLEVAFTSSTHAYVTYREGDTVTINRVEYRPSAHLYKWADGRFHLGREAQSTYDRRQSASVTRANWVKVADMYASEPARARFVSEVEQAVNNFAVNNNETLIDAEIENRKDEARQAAQEYKEAVKAMNAARKVLDEAEARIEEYLREVGR